MSQSAIGRSVRPTEPAKRTSPENRHRSAWNARWPGEWPGTWTRLERDPGELDRLVAGELHVGRVAANAHARVVVARARQHGRLDRRDVDRRARPLGEVGDRPRGGRSASA